MLEERDYAILTAEISKAAFGMTPIEYKKFKGLKKENLRDHMNDLELIFNMLGEASTTRIARNKDTKGFIENKEAKKMCLLLKTIFLNREKKEKIGR